MCENSLDHIQENPMRFLSNSFPGVAAVCLPGTSMLVAFASVCRPCLLQIPQARGCQLVQFLYSNSKKSQLQPGPNPRPPWAALQTAVGRLTWTLRSPICENSLACILKNFLLKALLFVCPYLSPCGPPGRWDVQKNLLLVHLHVKPSPCCRPLCLSGTSMIVDLSMGLFMQLPHAHFQSKRRPVLPNFPYIEMIKSASKTRHWGSGCDKKRPLWPEGIQGFTSQCFVNIDVLGLGVQPWRHSQGTYQI